MQDATLIKIAFVTALFGLLGLYALFSLTEIPLTEPSSTESTEYGSLVRIRGTIDGLTHRGNTTIVNLGYRAKLPVVAFEKLNLTKGLDIEVIGTLEEYNGNRELIAEKILI